MPLSSCQVSPKTAKAWLELLERMYLVFAVWPYSRSLPRAILKPPMVFFFDNADIIGDEDARFENIVATHLLKRLHFIEDHEGHHCELRYLRDKERREVDFVILKDGEIHALVEAKKGEAGGRELDLLLHRARIEIIPFNGDQVELALTAWRKFGKGNHPAGLNIGGCCAYALTKTSGEPLLFKDKDFTRTDIRPVIDM